MSGSQRPGADDFPGTQWLIRETSHNSCAELRQTQCGILQRVSSGTFFHKISVTGHPHFKPRELIHQRRNRFRPHGDLLADYERCVKSERRDEITRLKVALREGA